MSVPHTLDFCLYMIVRNEVRTSSRGFQPELNILPPPPEDFVRYEVISVLYERLKAVLLRVGNSETWLPKKLIRIGLNEGGKLVVDVPEWLAKKHKYFTEHTLGQTEKGLGNKSAKSDEVHCIIYQEIKQTTHKAYQIRFNINKPLVWLPKDKVKLSVNKDGERVVFVPHWLAVTHKLVKPPPRKLRKIQTRRNLPKPPTLEPV